MGNTGDPPQGQEGPPPEQMLIAIEARLTAMENSYRALYTKFQNFVHMRREHCLAEATYEGQELGYNRDMHQPPKRRKGSGR